MTIADSKGDLIIREGPVDVSVEKDLKLRPFIFALLRVYTSRRSVFLVH